MSSLYEEILDQVKAGIENLTLTETHTVVRRKRFVVHDQDSLPIIVVCPDQDSETEDDDYELSVVMTYGVFVGIVHPTGNLLNSTSEDAMLEDRQTIRRAMRSVNAVAPSECPCVDVSCNPSPPFDRAAFKANHDASALVFRYSFQEPRIA